MEMPNTIGDTTTGPSRHKRTPSAVLRSIVSARTAKTQELEKSGLTKASSAAKRSIEASRLQSQVPLGEIHHNRERGRSAHLVQQGMDSAGLHDKRSKSIISLKAITGKDKNKQPQENTKKQEKSSLFKKSKSSTNISAYLPKSKTTNVNERQLDQQIRNKENEPPTRKVMDVPPPIWAQFSRKDDGEHSQATKVPLNDTWKVEDEAALYTPQDYSPSKGRIFPEEPSLKKHSQERPSSKGSYFDGSRPVSQLVGTFDRLRKVRSASLKKEDVEDVSRDVGPKKRSSRPTTAEEEVVGKCSSKPTFGMAKGGSRVKAAVAAFSGKSEKSEQQLLVLKETKPVKSEIESAFEKMLESRNIPPEVREKMRALDTNMKADLIKQNSTSSPSLDGAQWPAACAPSRPGTAGRSATDNSISLAQIDGETNGSKKPRPRSLNFTLKKGDESPTKKQRSGRSTPHVRTKSADLPRSISATSLNSVASTSSFKLFNRAPKPAVPDDFISYLGKVQKPQEVEVGKIQKLKQLLRNETVTWVDQFISDGGMVELINLLYRIIEIEWREEHEDNLLHHTLTCLKALMTTSSALRQLEGLQSKLFPTLLAVLFSSGEERKGPAEFPTRGLIVSLLFSYLAASPTPSRAATLLGYLRDPRPAESATPLGFIADMRRSRPYKLWCTEVTNVSKEVFWIFLHSVNVIPYPEAPSPDMHYCSAHFPAPRPPVPAAPYVGSVEWDATIYLATHLDLLNGLVASIPSADERNSLRMELRDSGFERVMGGQLRICKEKFYGHVHAGLITWVGAARADGWSSKDVREGPPKDELRRRAKSSSPAKKKAEKAPMLDMPKLDLGIGVGDRLNVESGKALIGDDDWL